MFEFSISITLRLCAKHFSSIFLKSRKIFLEFKKELPDMLSKSITKPPVLTTLCRQTKQNKTRHHKGPLEQKLTIRRCLMCLATQSGKSFGSAGCVASNQTPERKTPGWKMFCHERVRKSFPFSVHSSINILLSVHAMHHINIYFYQIDFLVLILDFKKNEFLDLVSTPLSIENLLYE